jgi:HSP20 family molecular chaperone IbpA
MSNLRRTEATGSPFAPPWAWGPVSRHPWFRPSDTLQSTSWAPPLDLSETAEALHVTVELAGVEP